MKVIYTSQKKAPAEQNINSSKYTAPLGLCAGVINYAIYVLLRWSYFIQCKILKYQYLVI